MDNIIIDERTGLHYELVGDYYLVAGYDETERKSIGIWGQRHLRYIRQYKKHLYSELLTSGKLQGYLIDTNKQAEEMFSRLVTEMARQQNITEILKAENQMLWVHHAEVPSGHREQTAFQRLQVSYLTGSSLDTKKQPRKRDCFFA